VVGDEPADVGVQQAADRAEDAGAAADVRAVRVALLVGVRVVLAVVGDPVDDRALDGHRPGGGEEVLDRLGGPERAVGEHAMEADRHAEAGDDVHDGEEREVVQADDVVPEHDDRGGDHDRGQDDGEQVHDAGGLRHVLDPRTEVDDPFALSPRPSAANL